MIKMTLEALQIISIFFVFKKKILDMLLHWMMRSCCHSRLLTARDIDTLQCVIFTFFFMVVMFCFQKVGDLARVCYFSVSPGGWTDDLC